jgi:cellulose 1,4-beta-cellobiosidase
LAWAFANGQMITQLWNGSYTQSGGSVIVTNVSYNGTIAAGGNTSFGFNGSWSGTNSVPSTFKLNGVTCSIV